MGIHDGHREKKRQQFLRHGLDSFADHEVLELLLFYAIPRKDTNPIAHALMDRFGSLDAVLSAPVEELGRSAGEQILKRVEEPDAPVFEKVLSSAYKPHNQPRAWSHSDR